jgi:hypothetical protein
MKNAKKAMDIDQDFLNLSDWAIGVRIPEILSNQKKF